MNQNIINRLREITQEEQVILDGQEAVDWEQYMQDGGNVINSKKLLKAGNLIRLRTHTRFVHFPPHTHDYVEMVYMCQGSTTHFVNSQEVRLEVGDLLLIKQSATHEICRAGYEDIAVNFIVMPEFFNNVLSFMGEEETQLRWFLMECVCGKFGNTAFLHFKAADVKVIENLIENLLISLLFEDSYNLKACQMTISLLFLQLMSCAEMLEMQLGKQTIVFKVLSYIETNYATANLSELAECLYYNLCNLSREIKRKTGKSFTQLVQEKRLAQAAFLLKNTEQNVDAIANAVGYENISYFHRIFKKNFGVSPRKYRLQMRSLFCQNKT